LVRRVLRFFSAPGKNPTTMTIPVFWWKTSNSAWRCSRKPMSQIPIILNP